MDIKLTSDDIIEYTQWLKRTKKDDSSINCDGLAVCDKQCKIRRYSRYSRYRCIESIKDNRSDCLNAVIAILQEYAPEVVMEWLL